MTLRRLTSLEAGKLRDENARLLQQIKDLKALLADPKAVSKVIADEVTELARKHGDDRRTKVPSRCKSRVANRNALAGYLDARLPCQRPG